jgi:hypothetical protein
MSQLTPKQCKDIKVLITFVSVYCQSKHGDTERSPMELPLELTAVSPRDVRLCTDCAGLVGHAIEKRRLCPLDPKPSCKKCHIHCYSRQHRDKIREIMSFSGRHLILRGRLQYLWHYFL